MARNTKIGNTGCYPAITTALFVLLMLVDGVGSVRQVREAVLKQNLCNLRSAIDQYTMDRQRAPQDLQELVAAGYYRAIPVDPVTGKADWVTLTDETLMSVDASASGISDVHSRSRSRSRDGSRYETW
jgi:general secretion pathway protein G